MKKLMIAAAAAAMVSGAFAEISIDYGWWGGTDTNAQKIALFEPVKMNEYTNEVGGVLTTNIDNIVTLDKLQIITYKNKANPAKFFCLNNAENATEKFYKPSKKSTQKNQAVDGAIYYDASKGWTEITWSKDKDENTSSTNMLPVTFYCYADKGGKKVWGSWGRPAIFETFKRDNGVIQQEAKEIYPGYTNNVNIVLNYNATTAIYAEIDVEKKQIKSLKPAAGSKCSLKTYKDAAARDEAIEKLLKKFEKAGGKF